MICSRKFHECNDIPCQHDAQVLKYNCVGRAGYSKYYVSIFWWTGKLYFTSTNKYNDNIDNICDFHEDINNNDSEVIYIHYIVDSNI